MSRSKYQAGAVGAHGSQRHGLLLYRALRAGVRVFVPFRWPLRSPALDPARADTQACAFARPRYAPRRGRASPRAREEILGAHRAAGPSSWDLALAGRARPLQRLAGSGPGSYHLAIDIGGEIGAKVRLGWWPIRTRPRGYGNLLLLIHPVSDHHVRAQLGAARGLWASVDVGDVIAEAEQRAAAAAPHVHFELMFAGENCDPTSLLLHLPR